jgi:hypothetical protein
MVPWVTCLINRKQILTIFEISYFFRATVGVNQLIENPVAPAASVWYVIESGGFLESFLD